MACVITAHMALLNIAFIFGSVARLIQGSHSFLSLFDVTLGLAMAATGCMTTYWTFFRLRRALAGYVALVVLLAAQMAVFPQLPEATSVVFIEVTFACVGAVVYVAPLILLLRVRGTLQP